MKQTGFGVIGVGTWGQNHAQVYAFQRGGYLAAVCDADGDRARAVADSLGVEQIYTDYHDLLADTAVDAVSIVLPDFMHCEAAIAAAEAGKHILVEKPLATTEDECLRMIEAARLAGVHLFVDFHNRWSPLFNSLKMAYDAGELGEAQYISYRLNDTLYVPTQMLRWAGRSSVAWFLASHCLDTLLWLMDVRGGGDSIERLTCITRSRILKERGIDTPDFYHTTLEWKSGLVTHLENCWILPESGPSIVDLKCEFLGSQGAMYIDAAHHGAVQKQVMTAPASYPDAFVTPTVQGRVTGLGVESIRHFADCIINGGQPLVDGIDGLAVTRLILKMEESALENRPVEVGELYR